MSYQFTLSPPPSAGPAALLPADAVYAALERTSGMAKTAPREWTWLVAVAPLSEEEIRRRVETLEKDNRLPDDMFPVDLGVEPLEPPDAPPARLIVRVPFSDPPEVFPTVLDLVFELARKAELTVRDDVQSRTVTERDRKALMTAWTASRERGRRMLGTRFGYRPVADGGERPAGEPAPVLTTAAPPLSEQGTFPIGFLLLLLAIFGFLWLLHWMLNL